jgi:hypothetical protein
MGPEVLPTYMLIIRLSKCAYGGTVYVCHIQAHTMSARCRLHVPLLLCIFKYHEV